MSKYRQSSQATLKKRYGSSKSIVADRLVYIPLNLGANTIKLKVHKKVAGKLLKAAANYRKKVKAGKAKPYALKAKYCGSFNWRHIRRANGTESPNLSMHSFGIAFDLNSWHPNGQGSRAKSDIPRELRRSMARYGFFWGGNWKGSTRDPMHFEYAPLSFK